jgi:ribose transport system permease protein
VQARGAGNYVALAQRRYPIVQLAVLAIMFGFGSVSIPGFDSAGNINALLVVAAILGFAAAGQTVVVLLGGIDLSVAPWIVAGGWATMQLSAVDGWPLWLALTATGTGALLIGGTTGYVCHRFRIEPLIVTLAVGAMIFSATLVWTNGNAGAGAPTPGWLQHLATPATKTFGLGIPPLVVIWAAFSVAIGLTLARTPVGRRLYATAMSQRAAELALVRTRRVWIAAFAFSALMGAFAGLLVAGFAGVGDSSVGDAYLWQSVTAVVVGGTVGGGVGDYWRTVIGSLLIVTFSTVLIGHGASTADNEILFGVLIFACVGFYGRDQPVRNRV